MKECKVLTKNDFYVLVEYGEYVIQFPPMNIDTKTVFVDKVTDGVYKIVDNQVDEVAKEEVAEKPKRKSKKVSESEN